MKTDPPNAAEKRWREGVRDLGFRERFDSRVMPVPFSGCYEWLGKADRLGYGRIWVSGGYQLAHRVAYFIEYGVLRDDQVICHRCDNPSCVRPEHLFAGTQADNIRDAQRKGRLAVGDRHGSYRERHHSYGKRNLALCEAASVANRGEGNGKAKMSEAQAYLALREGWPRQRIADEFGVNYQTASDLVAGRTWKHLRAD